MCGREPRRLEGVAVGDHLLEIQLIRAKDARDHGLAHVFEPLDGVTGNRLHPHDLDRRLHRLQIPPGTHQRARGAHACHEVVDLTAGLLEDLGPRGLEVGERVRLVLILVGHVVLAREGLHERMSLTDGPVDVVLGRGLDHVGAEPLQDETPLGADALRHAELHLVAFGRPDHGDGDACIAGGRLEDDLALGELTGLLSLVDHVESRPVLDRPSGVTSFKLAEDLHLGTGVQIDELDKGSVTDRLQ